jgi:HD-like signal output (HDOD) protein
MNIATTFAAAESQLNPSAMQETIGKMVIPPRPAVVQQMQAEMGKADPDLRRVAQIVSQDIGLTVAVLKVVNSPLYSLSRKAETVEQAVGLIGLRQMSLLVTAVSMRSAMPSGAPGLTRFFDTASKRSYAMARIAKTTKGLAQMFGLFCDVGIPLLMGRFPNYMETLKVANIDTERSFTSLEQAAHHTDHALIGAMMVKSWDLPHLVALAIRLHHDYAIFLDSKVPQEVTRLIALSLVAEVAIQRFGRLHSNVEWFKGGDYVPGALVMAPGEIEEWIEQLVEEFATGIE